MKFVNILSFYTIKSTVVRLFADLPLSILVNLYVYSQLEVRIGQTRPDFEGPKHDLQLIF